MSLPMMDFMPDDLRRVVHVQRSKRRIALLGILLLVFSVGVSLVIDEKRQKYTFG